MSETPPPSNEPVQQGAVAERTGIPLRTLYRRLGARGNEPFTGKAKPKGRRR